MQMSAGSVDIEKASFRYSQSDRLALNEVNLSIAPGEFILVAGPSGCGKSTLGSMINGLIPHLREGSLEGRVRVGGVDTRTSTIGDLGLRVGTVFQDPRTQFFTLNTSEEVAFGCRNHGMDRTQIAERVTNSFAAVGMPELAGRDLLELSSGEKQKVALAACYALGPRIFLLDEPSANLDPAATAELTKMLAELKRSGATIIVLEHRLYYLTGLIDRVAYLNEGRIQTIYSAGEFLALSKEQLTGLGLRGCTYPIPLPLGMESSTGKPATPTGACTFTCEGIGFHHPTARPPKADTASGKPNSPGLEDITLQVTSGEIVGITGANGAGKTTLARVCAGLEKEQAGRVLLNGIATPARDRLGRVYLVVQDSGYQLFSDTVIGELRLGRRKTSLEAEASDRDILTRLGLWTYRDAHPAALSRGQQQRLTIAAALAADASVFIFDEPSSGLDYRAMATVAGLITQLAEDGKIVLVISHDNELLAACCTRLVTIDHGRVIADAPMKRASLQSAAAETETS